MFTIYHIIFYLVFLSCCILKNNRDQQNWFWFCVWLIIILTGIRDITNYSDLANYQSYYKTGEIEDFMMAYDINFGFDYLNKFFYGLGFSFQSFLFLVGAFIIGAYGWFINKYSTNRLLSFAIFILINYVMSLAALRQFMACAVILFAIDAAIKRRIVPYLIYVFIAFSFHTSAIVVLPVYFIFGVNINKRTKWILLGATVLITVGLNIIAANLSAINGYYANYLNEENENSVYRTLMKLFICLLYFYALRDRIFEKDMRFMLLICLIINVVLYMGGSQISGLYRLRNYFEISEIIGIPLILRYSNAAVGVKRLILRGGVIAYLVLLFISFTGILSSDGIVINSGVYKTIFGSI